MNKLAHTPASTCPACLWRWLQSHSHLFRKKMSCPLHQKCGTVHKPVHGT